MDCQSNYGRTALHWACAVGHFSVVRELLSSKANTNIRDSNENLPIDYVKNETVLGLMQMYLGKSNLKANTTEDNKKHILIEPR